MSELPPIVRRAIDRRAPLIERLSAEQTDCYRLFHGPSEDWPGLVIDRYGPRIRVQTVRRPLPPAERAALEALLAPLGERLVWVDRSDEARHEPAVALATSQTCRELGLVYPLDLMHPRPDPVLFCDLRAARRWVRSEAGGRRVLNLFSYSGGVGLNAAAGGATEVWNVDVARSSQEAGEALAALNQLSGLRWIHEDVIPVLRQLAGLPVKGRGAQRPYQRFEPAQFDLVVLDPPRWAKSPFGAIDVLRDYPALLKPALGATAQGGRILATHNIARVPLGDWLSTLTRCATKAGRPLKAVEPLTPDADFPTLPDGAPALKMAILEL